MTNSEHESTAAWRELLDTLSGLDRSFLDGERAVTDDRQIAVPLAQLGDDQRAAHPP